MSEKDTGKIYITISNKQSGDNVPQPGIPDANKLKKSDWNVTKDFLAHEFYSTIKSAAMSSANYALSNIGNFTGNYELQSQIQAAISIASQIYGIGMSIASGVSVGGVWGGVAAGVASITLAGVNYGQQAYSEWFENKRINREISVLRERSGLNSLMDGSRGTEN